METFRAPIQQQLQMHPHAVLPTPDCPGVIGKFDLYMDRMGRDNVRKSLSYSAKISKSTEVTWF
jgi:hypothetical protein